MKIKIFKTPQEACIGVIKKIIALQESNKKVTIALSGGNTPKLLFKLIASEYPKAIGSNVHFYWGDERMVPCQSEESNYGVFYRELIERGVISAENVHPIPYNSNYLIAKEEVESVIRKEIGTVNVALNNDCNNNDSNNNDSNNNDSCSSDGVLETLPQFSLVILGVGEDGHVASIFPDNLESFNSHEITEIVQHPISGQTRITLTGKTINAAKEIIMLCTGSSKKEIIKEIIEKQNPTLPAVHVVPECGVVEWYLDCGSSPQ